MGCIFLYRQVERRITMREAIENVMIEDGGFAILFKAYCIAGLIVCAVVVTYFTGMTIKEAILIREHKKRVKMYEKYQREHRCENNK